MMFALVKKKKLLCFHTPAYFQLMGGVLRDVYSPFFFFSFWFLSMFDLT